MFEVEKLHCYASGDGALHFCWQRDGKATGRKVTTADAKAYLKSKEARSLHDEGWRVVTIDGAHPVLVAPVKRVGDNQLESKGVVFTYTIDETNVFWYRDRELVDNALRITFDHPDLGTRDVINYSTRARIRHFLNHEQDLKGA